MGRFQLDMGIFCNWQCLLLRVYLWAVLICRYKSWVWFDNGTRRVYVYNMAVRLVLCLHCVYENGRIIASKRVFSFVCSHIVGL